MRKYRILLIALLVITASFIYGAHEETAIATPACELVPHYSNFLMGYTDGANMLLGNDAYFFGGFTDDCFIYSPTNKISDTLRYDTAVGGESVVGTSYDGPFFEHLKYDQLFMGTVIISENGYAESGGRAYGVFNHTHFTKLILNQNQDFSIGGTQNPTFESLGFGKNFYLDRHFVPLFPHTGNMETYLKVKDDAGISITQRTAQFPSSNWNNVYALSLMSGGTFSVTDATPKDLENVVIKNYTITNNTDQDKEIYITQRLDTAINCLWDTAVSTVQIGDYDVNFYVTQNNGEFDDYAGFQYPVTGIADHGYFGYTYDNSYSDTYTGMGVKLLGDDPTPASFKIIPYHAADADLDGNGVDYTNRLVKYGIKPSAAQDPYFLGQFFLKPYNPMEYFNGSEYYNDFVDPGTVDPDVTAPGNYAIALTAGPFTIKAGESKNVAFAICAGSGSSKTDMLTNLDTMLNDANEAYKAGFKVQDLNPPSIPKYRAVYETYDTSSDTVVLKLKWDPEYLTENETFPTPLGSSYNLYMTTGPQAKDLKYSRLNINDPSVYTQIFGSLKNAPTSYDMYTSTSWTSNSVNYDQHDSYLFALSANDEKWYSNYLSTPADKNYFNESDPNIEEVYLFPSAINVQCDFAYDNNSNFIKVSYTNPTSFERDLDYYTLYRDKSDGTSEVEKIYLQAGVYKEIKALTTPTPIKLYLDDSDYIIYSNDLVFNNDDVLDDVFINNTNVKLIVDNFYLQKFSETSPLTISDTDPTLVPYVLTLVSTEKTVKYDSNAGLYYWEKQDDYGNTYYQVSDGSTHNTLPASVDNATIMYSYGTPEKIIDYTELEGDTTYYYSATKRDLLGNSTDMQGNYGIVTYPNHPTNLVVKDQNKSIKLTWDPATGDIYRYYVYRCSNSDILKSNDPVGEDYVSKIGAVLDTGATQYEFIDNYIDNYSTYYYFVTAYNRNNSTESDASNIGYDSKDFDYEQDLTKAHAVPNPYFYGSRAASKENGDVVFINLTPNADIYIYTIRGNLITVIHHTASSPTAYGPGGERWDLKNDSGNQLSTGLYFYLIKNPDKKDDVKKGKIAIIR